MGCSYIIQLTTDPDMAEKYFWITEENFYETNNLNGYADYFETVTDDDFRKEIIDSFVKVYGLKRGAVKSQDTGDKIRWVILDKDKYRNGQYKQFRTALKEASQITKEDFKADPELLYSAYNRIKRACENPLGYYIVDDSDSWDRMTHFMDHYKENTPLYFGGIVKFHY